MLNKKEHCVVVVAEGAGQDVLGKMGETDASGNPVLQNFAKFVQAEMKEKLADLTPDIKYIDPTYMVRACPTNSSDAIYCSILGQNAVHAAFAGITGATVGLCNGHYVYLPIQPLISRPREWLEGTHVGATRARDQSTRVPDHRGQRGERGQVGGVGGRLEPNRLSSGRG